MPYKTISAAAALFVQHKDVSVYHTYDNDDVQSNIKEYYFVLNKEQCLDESFDVRDLKTWSAPVQPPFLQGANDTPENKKAWEEYQLNETQLKHVKAVIIAAIDSGELTAS